MEEDKLEVSEQKRHARCDMQLLSSFRNMLFKEAEWFDNEHFAKAAVDLVSAIDELADVD